MPGNALRSLAPEERADLLRELDDTIRARRSYQHHLARLTREAAPEQYLATLRGQIAACRRHEDRAHSLLADLA